MSSIIIRSACRSLMRIPLRIKRKPLIEYLLSRHGALLNRYLIIWKKIIVISRKVEIKFSSGRGREGAPQRTLRGRPFVESICRFVDLSICRFVDSSICRFVDSSICQLVDSSTRRNTTRFSCLALSPNLCLNL